MRRNLLWLALIALAGVQVFGSWAWMSEVQGEIGRLSGEVERLREANLFLERAVAELSDKGQADPLVLRVR